MQEQIINRVKKLLALSRSSNLHEAAAATAIANKLILQHRVLEADLIEKHAQDRNNGEYFPEPIFDDPEPVYETGRSTPWKVRLLYVLTQHYGCAVHHDKSQKASNGRSISRFRLIGRNNDVQVTKCMFRWLMTELQNLCDMECKGFGHAYISAYCEGAVKGIEKCLRQTHTQMQQLAEHHGKSAALVRLSSREEEAKQYLWKKYRVVQPPPKPQVDPRAFERGLEMGNHIGSDVVAYKEE